MGVISGAANLFFIYRFLRILTTAWEDSDAFKLGIIDENGKILKKKNKLKGKEEKEAYTMMHRFVWKMKRLMEKIPFGKSRLASYAAALWLIKEEKDFHGTDNELQESFLSFLETDWKNEALILKENYEGDMDKKTYSNLKAGIDIKKADMKDVIKDFQSSDAPQFKGKSEKKKKEMAIAAKLSKEEVELDEVAPWKKGKYKVTDGKTGKVLGTFNSGSKAQKYVDKIWDKGDYDSLTVELGEKVVYTRADMDEAVLVNRDYKYDGKVIKISKKNFSKVHRDFKGTTKGKETMITYDSKEGTVLVPVEFTEGFVLESSKEYAKSLERIANDKKMSMISKSEKRTLLKIADMLAKEKKEETEPILKNYDPNSTSPEGTVCPECDGEGCDHCGGKGYHTEAKRNFKRMVSKKDQKRYREKEISHQDYLRLGAGKDGKNWTTGSGKNLKYWTHSKEEVEPLISTFAKFITEGRPAGVIRGLENTAADKERQKLVDSQEKKYTLKDIESIARKHKVRLSPVEPPMKFGGEWTIKTDKGISLIYDERRNDTEVSGWRVDKKKLRQYKDRYESEDTRIQDVVAGIGRGRLSLRGFESAFEVIGEQLIEAIAANATGTAVVGTGDDPTVWKKKKRKNAKVETEEFAGRKVFVVSPERYWDSRMGKSRYNRYEKYVGNDKLGETIRQYGRTNPNSPIILKNSENGAMLYLKYGK